MYYKIAEHRPN